MGSDENCDEGHEYPPRRKKFKAQIPPELARYWHEMTPVQRTMISTQSIMAQQLEEVSERLERGDEKFCAVNDQLGSLQQDVSVMMGERSEFKSQSKLAKWLFRGLAAVLSIAFAAYCGAFFSAKLEREKSTETKKQVEGK